MGFDYIGCNICCKHSKFVIRSSDNWSSKDSIGPDCRFADVDWSFQTHKKMKLKNKNLALAVFILATAISEISK